MGKNSSFLPEDYLERKVARRTNLICITLFLVMLAAIGGAFYVQGRQDDSTRGELTRVNLQFGERAQQLRTIEQLQSQQTQMVEKAKIVRELVERVPRSIILAEMTNAMPSSLSLLEFSLESKLAQTAPRPRTALERDRQQRNRRDKEEDEKVEIVPRLIFIEIEGVAPNDTDVSAFMENLTRHPLFIDVGLEFSQEFLIEKNPMRKFRVTMRLNPDVTFDYAAPEQLDRDLMQDPLAEQIQINPEGDVSTPDPGVVIVPTPNE
ncbi:MAG: PilN domain-containing protein [Planctomycetota bacterium]